MHQRRSRSHVQDSSTTSAKTAASRHSHGHDWRGRALRVYHYSLWLFLVLLLILQPLGFVWRRIETTIHVNYGRSLLEGLFTVSGSTNDEPFTDRAIVCSLIGRLYKPMLLSELLASANKSSEQAATASVHGYRVISRSGSVLVPETRDFYANTCGQIATTLDGMLDACAALGYNVSGVEFLRVVPSDDTVVTLPTTLPVLVLPFWDSARAARYVVPSHDGHACMFRLSGKYTDASRPSPYMSGIDRSTREAKTAEWLALQKEGVWRHGWYEDPKMPTRRWYSDVYSTESPGAFGLRRRQFDMSTGVESDCVGTTACKAFPAKLYWGTDLYVLSEQVWATSITILDVNRNGLFLYESTSLYHTSSTYRLETVIANVSVTLLLFRWLVALVATQRAGLSIGIGAVSCARSFHVLPIVLLPRMKMIFAAFWTAGCVFEGDQRTLSEAWFVMYPSLAEFTLLFFSLLNLGAKLLRRRMSDALFGPTVLLLCLLHRMRSPIADSGMFEMSGRVSTRMAMSQFDALRLVDFVSPHVMFQLNGKIPSIFAMKLALLALNLAPLLRSDNTSVRSRVRAGIVRCDAERSMALRVACSGGLGRSAVYDTSTTTSVPRLTTARSNRNLDAIVPLPSKSSGVGPTNEPPRSLATGTLLPYELARVGYVVLGRDALVSMKDWFWFMASAPCRAVGIPMRHLRMVTFTVDEDSGGGTAWKVSERPTMCRVTDERFRGIGAWEISVRPLR